MTDTSEYIGKVAKVKSSFKYFAESKDFICQDYYPEPIKIEDFQQEWIDAIENQKKVAIISFTGSGKTSVLAVLYPLWKLFLNKQYKILIVSKTMEQSKKILSEIKYHINNSEYLQDLKPEDPSSTWTKTKIELSTSSQVFCVPYSESVRSFHVDLVISDEVAEFKPHEVYTRYVRTRIARRDGRIVNISTPKHENDLINKLAEGADRSENNISKKGYWSKTYPIMDEDGIPTYPEAFDKDDIRELKEEDPMAFEREYMCSATPIGGDLFEANDIVDSYDEDETFELRKKEDCEYYLGADFAVSSEGDWTVFTVMEVTKDKDYIIRYMERTRGAKLQAQEDRIKELHQIFDFKNIVVDETTFGQSIYQNLKDEYLPVEGQSFERKARNNLLINVLKKNVEGEKLVIPRGEENSRTITLTDQLYKELTGFGTAETPSGSVVYKSSTKYDDTVVSFAMALKAIDTSEPLITDMYFD